MSEVGSTILLNSLFLEFVFQLLIEGYSFVSVHITVCLTGGS